jgi:hypothetical protein
MKKFLLYLIRLTTVVVTLIAIAAALPPVTSLYFMIFEGAQAGDTIFADTFILPLYLSVLMLALAALLLWGAYVADRFAVTRLRALA